MCVVESPAEPNCAFSSHSRDGSLKTARREYVFGTDLLWLTLWAKREGETRGQRIDRLMSQPTYLPKWARALPLNFLEERPC